MAFPVIDEADPVLIDRLVSRGGREKLGSRPESYVKAHYQEAIRRLDGHMPRRSIAAHLSLSERTVSRWCQEMGLPPKDRRAPLGISRQRIRDLLLERPSMTAQEAGRLVGIDASTAAKHVVDLQAKGELPPRNNVSNALSRRPRGRWGSLADGRQ